MSRLFLHVQAAIVFSHVLNWNTVWQALIIAIVQGITEFLPVSSTGHMILAGHLIGFEGEFAKLYEIVIQLGTILAVPVLFHDRFFSSLKNLWPGQSGFMFWSKIAVACVPAGLLGLATKDFIDEHLMVPLPVAVALLVGALLIFAVEWYRDRDSEQGSVQSLDDVTFAQAFGIGVSQCLALWPGFSRSAATIIGGRLVGLNTAVAAEFSFFLAMPMMVLTSGYALYKASFPLTSADWAILAMGFVVSFLVAFAVVGRFIRFVQQKKLTVFAWYRLALSLAFFVIIGLGWL